jgi:ribonuclease HI
LAKCRTIFSDCATLPNFAILPTFERPMYDRKPHYLLISEASRTEGLGRWRFVLRPADGSAGTEVADVEPEVWGQRLELLTVVRALESLDQPSRVTLIGCSHYVEQGILFGLQEWKENNWQWEYFGQMVPVRDSDLWQRMDHVLKFHRVECGHRRIDGPHGSLRGPHQASAAGNGSWVDGIPGVACVEYHAARFVAGCLLVARSASRVWQKVLRHGMGTRSREFRVQGSGFRYS